MSEIFEKLICSCCKKYLSVFPIKVYPSRQVKCGRCNSSDKDGTVSKLYETIAKELKFPCVNHYEGCKTLLKPSEVILHEKTCIGTSIMCPVCNNFEGHSLDILDHFKQEHSSNYLNVFEFLISLDNKNEEKFYLYGSDSQDILSIIYVRYDEIVNKLYLDIAPIYVEVEHDTKSFIHKFDLYSIDNKIMYRSMEKKCSQYVKCDCLTISNDFDGDPIKRKFPNNLAICRFFIKEDKKICFKTDFPVSAVPHSETKLENKLQEINTSQVHTYSKTEPEEVKKSIIEVCNRRHYPVEPIRIIEPCRLRHFQGNTIMTMVSTNTGTQEISFNFDNIRGLKNRVYSDIFYLANTSWKVYIEKIFKQKTPYLAVYLNKEKNPHENKCSYKITDTTIDLLSINKENNSSKSFESHIFGLRKNETMDWGWEEFIPWSILLDPGKKYVPENDIEFDVNITLEKIFEHKSYCKCPGCK